MKIAVAMARAVAPRAFSPAQLGRLRAIGTALEPWPVSSIEHELDCDVLVGHWGCPRLDAAALVHLPRLRLVAYAAGTVKTVVTPELFARGVTVTSAAAANAIPVAEYTLAMILLANKDVLNARERMRDPDARTPRPRAIGNLGRRVGLIGASRVGRCVVELLRPFDLEVVVADPYLTDEDAHALGALCVGLDELLRTSDVVSVHAPDLPSTRGMLGKRELALIQDGATLVNTARGALVDTDALTEELVAGRISAVLDVTEPEPLPPDSPLHVLPNVFLTPHRAGAAGTELARLADLAIEEVERFAQGLPPLHPVTEQDLERIA